MGTLPTRQEILAGQPQVALPIDTNFQNLWAALTNGINDDNVDKITIAPFAGGTSIAGGCRRPHTYSGSHSMEKRTGIR
jgi:hypothetical protein